MLGEGGVSGEYHSKANCVSQADLLARLMETHVWCLPADSVGGGLNKGTMASACTFVWEKALALKPYNLVLPCISLTHLSSCCPRAGSQGE